MEAAYISALAALAGTAIGGLTSFATSWMTQQAQTRNQRLAAEKEKREDLFGRFVDEAVYADALQHKREDAAAMMVIYALANRIRLTSSSKVIASADNVTRIIMETYMAPNLTLEEVRATFIDRDVDPLRDFSKACREELQLFGSVL
jgi:hypothetical protein